MSLGLRINGVGRAIPADPETPPNHLPRDEPGLKGPKLGCGLEQCGACAVLAGGKPVMRCAAPPSRFAGREIVIIAGLSGR